MPPNLLHFVTVVSLLLDIQQLKFQPGIAPQLFEVTIEKIIIKCRERAGFFTGRMLRVVAAVAAIVAHAIDVIAACTIRLCADDTAIRELAHAERIRKRNPVDRVDVHCHVPLVKESRMNAV